jgi:glycosyltransferase involved in cell wall biosynthesis
MKLLNSVHLNLIEYGGAWNAAKRIVDSIDFVGGGAKLEGFFGDSETKSISAKTFFKIDHILGNIAQTNTTVSIVRGYSGTGWLKKLDARFPKTDVWNMHWMPGHMSLEFIDFLESRKVVWTMHDMNPFTAVCHYAGACDEFKKNCAKCPQVPKVLQPLIPLILSRKKKTYKALENLTMVSPSRWLYDECQASSLGRHLKIKHIPNPVPISKFEGAQKGELPTITILGSSYRNSKNSTIGALAILKLKRDFPNVEFNLQIVGEPFPELSEVTQFCLPTGSNGEVTGRFLEQSDILLYTSISDNLPNFLLEAQAAGNSIVAFERGGIPECFIPNVSGFLVEESEEEITTALLRILVSLKIRLEMSHAARQFIEQKNSFFTVGKEYSSLYEKIIDRS